MDSKIFQVVRGDRYEDWTTSFHSTLAGAIAQAEILMAREDSPFALLYETDKYTIWEDSEGTQIKVRTYPVLP